jgi:hypothetical protein
MWNVFLYVLLFFYKWGRRVAVLMRRKDFSEVCMVLENGTEMPMNPSARPHALVVKYRVNGGYRYRFVEQPKPAYGYASDALVVPSKKMLGMTVEVGECTFPLNVDEFNVGGSTMLTPLFNRWLCRNHLDVPPQDVLQATIVDSDVNVVVTKKPVYIGASVDIVA